MELFLGEYEQNIAREVAREESYYRGQIEEKLKGYKKYLPRHNHPHN